MVLLPGVALAIAMAERRVTTPGAGFRTSARLLTLKTAGAKRSSKHSTAGRRGRCRPAVGVPFERLHNRRSELRMMHILLVRETSRENQAETAQFRMRLQGHLVSLGVAAVA